MSYKMGRPEKNINWEKLNEMLELDATAALCALKLGVHKDTLIDRIKSQFNMSWEEYKTQFTDKTVHTVKAKMIEKALAGDNVCMIFVLKNLGGWVDKVESKLSNADGKVFKLKYSLDK